MMCRFVWLLLLPVIACGGNDYSALFGGPGAGGADAAAGAADSGESGGGGAMGGPGGASGDVGTALGGTSGDAGAGVDDAGGSAGPMIIEMIDDMEDGDAVVLSKGGRNGKWFTFADATPGSVWPPLNGDFIMVNFAPMRGDSKSAMHTNGAGFSDWGAAVGVNFKLDGDKLVFYDGSAYKGITFFARIESNSVTSVRVDISDHNSAPAGGVCQTEKNDCYDYFGKSITLSPDWQQFTLPFSELAQQNFGLAEPSLDTTQLGRIQFSYGKNAEFNFWVDDLAFYQ